MKKQRGNYGYDVETERQPSQRHSAKVVLITFFDLRVRRERIDHLELAVKTQEFLSSLV